MRLHQRRRQLHAAQQRFEQADADLRTALASLRTQVARHGPGAIVGTGVAGGAVAARLPLRGLLRIARWTLDAALLAMRLPAGLLAALPRTTPPPSSTERAS